MPYQRFLLMIAMCIVAIHVSAQISRKLEYPMNKVLNIFIDDEVNMNDNNSTPPSYMVTLNSNDSTVYAVDSGMVFSSTFSDGITVLVIRIRDSLFAYSNLKKVLVKKGDYVLDGEVIGYADYDPDKENYVMDFILAEGNVVLRLKKKDFVERALSH
jgi:hypothetical protein